jgi:hypothetical protein
VLCLGLFFWFFLCFVGFSVSFWGCFGVVWLLFCCWFACGCGVVLSVGGLEEGCRVGGFSLSVDDVF